MNRSELVFAKQKYVDYEVLSIISTFLQCIVGSAFNIAVSESSQLVSVKSEIVLRQINVIFADNNAMSVKYV